MVLAWIIAAFALLALVVVTVLYLRRTTTYKVKRKSTPQFSF